MRLWQAGQKENARRCLAAACWGGRLKSSHSDQTEIHCFFDFIARRHVQPDAIGCNQDAVQFATFPAAAPCFENNCSPQLDQLSGILAYQFARCIIRVGHVAAAIDLEGDTLASAIGGDLIEQQEIAEVGSLKIG